MAGDMHRGVADDGAVGVPTVKRINDAVYELYSSEEESILDVVFFHGLQVGNYDNAYRETWLSQRGDECWPQTWLARQFPHARILSVSYDSSAITGANYGKMDMEATGRSLVDSLVRQAGVGRSNPVVLVGHSLGGLVIKQVCLEAHMISSCAPLEPWFQHFLRNLKGIFFYATPHRGSKLANVASILPWGPSRMLKYLTLLNKETAKLNDGFCKLRKNYQWKASGVGESRVVFVPGLSRGVIVVPEESARLDLDYFAQLAEDHVTICKPKGVSCSSYQHLVVFILRTVGKVHFCQGVPVHASGLHSQVEHVKELLSAAPLVGIVGISGIGKSTLAKAVFNTITNDFEFTCFVEAATVAVNPKALETLILSNLYYLGMKVNNCEGDWSILNKRRVLLIIDDICSKNQIQTVLDAGRFSPESRIIVTCSKQEELRLSSFSIYFVRPLNSQASKKLFCHHAFRPKIPPELKHFKGLVQQAADMCDGSPLVLEVIGSCLYRSELKEYNVETWTTVIQRLVDVQALDGTIENRVCRKLRISYDALEDGEQNMFLDVATFFDGWSWDIIKAAWGSSWEGYESGCSNLIARCLLKHKQGPLSKEPVLYMHNILKNMGRIIAAEQKSHIWDYFGQKVEVLNLLGQEKENVNLKGLMLTGWNAAWGSELNLGSLAFWTELRLLILINVPVFGSWENLPKNLTLLHCRPINSRMPHFNVFSCLTKLAVIDLDTRLQLFRDNEKHDAAVLEGMGKMRKLQYFRLEGQYQELPLDLGNAQSLRCVAISSGTRLTKLPQSIGSLSSLTELQIRNTGLVSLPESFGLLSSLKNLTLECYHLTVLPDSFGQLLSLEKLNLFCCEEIKMLPESFGELLSLTHLDISVCPKLTELPLSFCKLPALRKLNISYCASLCFPCTFGPLPSLFKVALSGADYVPESITQLVGLQELRLSHVGAQNLPQNFELLSALKILHLRGCSFGIQSHSELQSLGWEGFYQRITQETVGSTLDFLVYLKDLEGLSKLVGETEEQIAYRICVKHFPCASLWAWPQPLLMATSIAKNQLSHSNTNSLGMRKLSFFSRNYT